MTDQRKITVDEARVQATRHAAVGEQFYRQAQFHQALPHYREAVRLWPESPELHYMLASAAWRVDELALVERHYLEALRLNPKHGYAAEALSQWYRSIQRVDLADRYSAAALALDPANPDFIVTRADVLAERGDPQGAWERLEPVLLNPEVADRALILLTRIAPKLGREQQAIEAINRRVREPGPPPLQRPQLHFAAAAMLDRMGRYDDAFEQARLAHAIFPRSYDRHELETRVQRQMDYSTREWLGSLPHATHGSRRPVFILGMPRSGTSLVEQILASHPQVYGAGELDAFAPVAAALSRNGPYPQSLGSLSQAQMDQIATAHLAALEKLNATATHVTDKTPYNFLHLDLIELLFPQAHVIHCVRDPLDTCLSCYMTDFTSGNEFAWDLNNLGHYCRQYRRLMEHWKQVLTIPMLEVRYEDVVRDIEDQTRRMLAFIGLPWDDNCLRFHESQRPMMTASRDQVRQPLYSTSIGRWRHYETHLAPLIAALGEDATHRTVTD